MTTNREWLYSLDVADLADWFDAEHVEHNERDERKAKAKSILNAESYKFASEPDAESYIDCGKVENDSREKLEEDVWKFANVYYTSNLLVYDKVIELLDRQASITRREVLTQPDERDEQIAELAARVDELEAALTIDSRIRSQQSNCIGELAKQRDELTAERDALADDLLTCNKEREEYRELFSKSLTLASEIVNLQP